MSGLAIFVATSGTLSVGHSLWHAGFMSGISRAFRGLPDRADEEADCLRHARSALWRSAVTAATALALIVFIEAHA